MPIKVSLEFTDISGSTQQYERHSQPYHYLAINGFRSNMVKGPLVYEFHKLRRGQANPIILDQCLWHSKSAKGNHQTSDYRPGGFRRTEINLYKFTEIVDNQQSSTWMETDVRSNCGRRTRRNGRVEAVVPAPEMGKANVVKTPRNPSFARSLLARTCTGCGGEGIHALSCVLGTMQ